MCNSNCKCLSYIIRHVSYKINTIFIFQLSNPDVIKLSKGLQCRDPHIIVKFQKNFKKWCKIPSKFKPKYLLFGCSGDNVMIVQKKNILYKLDQIMIIMLSRMI